MREYRKVLQANFRRLIERQGLRFPNEVTVMCSKQLYRVARGQSDITIGKLGDIANEIEVDIAEFFED